MLLVVIISIFLFLLIRPPPRSTRTDTLFPYTTLFRSSPLSAAITATSGTVNNWGAPSDALDGSINTAWGVHFASGGDVELDLGALQTVAGFQIGRAHV